MIFLSHTHADKEYVEPIAMELRKVFGQHSIFYDSWSIQPGDGIIKEMCAGLEKCQYFFFFVSKKSLQSKMVAIEWQNALYKSTREQVKIIPLRIDDAMMPAILLQNAYIDFYTHGPEVALRQMIDVISGKNTYQPTHTSYQNIRAYLTNHEGKYTIEFKAELFMEPHSRYAILVDNDRTDIDYTAIGETMFLSDFSEMSLSNGQKSNAICISRQTATSPGFSFTIEIKGKNKKEVKIKGAMRAIYQNREGSRFAPIPLIPVGLRD